MSQIAWVRIAVSLVFVGLIVYQAWRTVSLKRKIAASETWPVTAAEVESKFVEKHTTQKGGTSYRPKVTYHYAVMGEVMKHEKLLPGTYWTEGVAEKAVASIGRTLEVRYNPEKPREHLTGYDRVGWGNYVLIAVFVVVLVAMNLDLIL